MLRLIPILSRPGLLTFKNNWSKQSLFNKQLWRDLLVFCCVSYLLYGLFKLSSKGFGILYRYNDMTSGFLPAVFNALVLILFSLVFFSSCTFSLTNLYLAEDLELIMASPISKFKFFYNKLLQIFVNASWIIYLSSVPCVLAIAGIYHVNAGFYLDLAVISIPLLILPVCLAIITTTMITRFLSGNHLRILLPTLTVFILLTVFSKSHAFFSNAQKKDINSILEILSNLHNLNQNWLSFTGIGDSITNSLLNRGSAYTINILVIYIVCAFAITLSYISIAYFHGSSLTKMKNASRNLNLSSKHSQQFIRLALPWIGKPYRAVILKEFKIFARDFSHLIQVAIILIICLFYLYNFQHLFNTNNYFTVSQIVWQNLTFLCNLAFGTLIITSLCTRFVYSSVSLEGKCLWSLTSSPLSLAEILKYKFKTWYLPVLIFSIVIFVSGCFALQSEPHLIALTVLTCFVTSYSMTGMAVGLGALFANFTWVHNSQIFASTGSLLFIFLSIMLTAANISLLSLLLFCDLIIAELELTRNFYYAGMILLASSFILGNYFAAKVFLKAGEKSLANKLE